MKPRIAVAALAAFTSCAQAAPELEWKVVNPFPLMKTQDVTAFAPKPGDTIVSHLQAMSATSMDSPVRTDPANLSGLGYSRAYVQGRTRTVRVRMKDADPAAECRWFVPGGKPTASVKCVAFVDFIVPRGGGKISVASAQLGSRTETITIDEKVIVGLGDSYSSGEGNPDRPAYWRFDGRESIFAYDHQTMEERYRWPQLLATQLSKDAEWTYRGCHRSLWSFQALAALAYANADPHRVVTFLFYSCSGAEIDELIDHSQIAPGGGPDLPPQVDQAARDLCAGNIKRGKDGKLACSGKMRRVDAILLTIGGNDAGFAKVIEDEILPPADDGPTACLLRAVLKPIPASKAKDLIAKLPAKWAALQDAFKATLDVSADRVFVPAYPNLLIDSLGDLCDERSKPMLAGLKSLFPSLDFTLSKQKAEEAQEGLIKPMHTALTTGAPGWQVVDAHLAPARLHGMCAVKSNPATELAYPLPNPSNLLWDGGRTPEQWQAYDPNQPRWYRTPNDSILTQWSQVKPWINKKQMLRFPCPVATIEAERLKGLQSLAAFGIDMIMGAFHPTARYHAEAADALVPVMRRTLDGGK